MELRRNLAAKLLKRGLPGLALISLLLFSIVPLPMLVPTETPSIKDLSVPFPCMYSKCGCRSAAQCGKSCCCSKAIRKMDSKAASKVKSPDSGDLRDAPVESNLELCSMPGINRQTDRIQVSPEDRPVTEGGRETGDRPAPDDRHASSSQSEEWPKTETSFEVQWVRGPAFSVCHGQSSMWLCQPTSVVPVQTQLVDGATVVREMCLIESERLSVTEAMPPVPPPKLPSCC